MSYCFGKPEDTKEYWKQRHLQTWSRTVASKQQVTDLQSQLSQAKARERHLVRDLSSEALLDRRGAFMQEEQIAQLRPQVSATYVPSPEPPQYVVRNHSNLCPPYYYPGRGFALIPVHLQYKSLNSSSLFYSHQSLASSIFSIKS